MSMIAIVGASVVATIMVIRINSTSHKPVPKWLHFVVLKLSCLACLDAPKTMSQPFANAEKVRKYGNFEDQQLEERQYRHDWILVARVVDRYFMVIFIIATVAITATLLVIIVVGSEKEFEEEIDILYNEWAEYTSRDM